MATQEPSYYIDQAESSSRVEGSINSSIPHSVAVSMRATEESVRKNTIWAQQLMKEGYNVTWNEEKTAFYATIGKGRKEHEYKVVEILAQNGISATLDREGNVFVKIKGRRLTAPSVDGRLYGELSHEIYSFDAPPTEDTVVDAISHTYKPFHQDMRYSVRADVAITFCPASTKMNRSILDAGVEEFLKRQRDGETKATPSILLHIDERERKVYMRKLK